jgi:hypothetical protein
MDTPPPRKRQVFVNNVSVSSDNKMMYDDLCGTYTDHLEGVEINPTHRKVQNINHFPSRVIKESRSNSNILPISTLSVENHRPFGDAGYKQKGVSSPVDIGSNKNIDSRNESNSENYDDVEEMEVNEDLPIVQKVPQSVVKYKSSNQLYE